MIPSGTRFTSLSEVYPQKTPDITAGWKEPSEDSIVKATMAYLGSQGI